VQVDAGRAVFESTPQGLRPSDRVIVSQLSNVRDGMAIAEAGETRDPVKTAQAIEPGDLRPPPTE
jgi:hypothetical protein